MLPDVYSSDNFEMVNKTGEQFFDEYWKTGGQNQYLIFTWMGSIGCMNQLSIGRIQHHSNKRSYDQYLEYKSSGIELSNLNSGASTFVTDDKAAATYER